MASSCARNSKLLRTLSGCAIGRPAAIAICLTGGGVSSFARPTGRSGCVTTNAISCPAAINASSVGTANRGVPQKMSFMRNPKRPALPRAFALHFANLAQVQVALQRAHAGNEQYAVEVIDFMLKGAPQQLFSVHLEPLAILILCANRDFEGALDLLTDVRKTE